MPEDTGRINGNGRRWYDPNKMVWAAFGLIGTLAAFIFIAAYSLLSNGINENRVDIKGMTEIMIEQRTMQTTIINRLDGIDSKLE